MEMLILAGVSMLGYKLSSAAKATAVPAAAPYDSQNIQGPLCAMYANAHDQMLDPINSGVVGPNSRPQPCKTMPFFTSERTQNTNTKFKQARMEMFTGATDMCRSVTGTYQNKKEQPALFSPTMGAAPLTSSGTAGNANSRPDVDRYYVSGVQNNTGPVDRIQVGPGLGLGPDNTAGQGGFHPYLRILPKNVGEYKINRGNALPARNGGSIMESPPILPDTAHNRQPINLHQPRALLPTSGQNISGPMTRTIDLEQENFQGDPNSNTYGPNRLVDRPTGEYYGGATAGGQAVRPGHGNSNAFLANDRMVHVKGTDGRAPEVLNAYGPSAPLGGSAVRLSERPYAQQLPMLNAAPQSVGAGLGLTPGARSGLNSLRPTSRVGQNVVNANMSNNPGTQLPLGMPSANAFGSAPVRHSADKTSAFNLFAQQTLPAPTQYPNQRTVGNPSGSGGSTVASSMREIRADRPTDRNPYIVPHLPGAQNDYGNPTPARAQAGASTVRSREALLSTVNAGAFERLETNQEQRTMMGRQTCHQREVWQRTPAPGGGLSAVPPTNGFLLTAR